VSDVFSLDGRVALVTGGTGAIGGALARGLAGAGARVVVLARRVDGIPALGATTDDPVGVAADVRDLEALERARDAVVTHVGAIDVLVNAAGGNVAAATVADDRSPFDIPPVALREVVDLNLAGTVLPTQVFGPMLRPGGSIVNVSSMAAARALTRVGGYGAAKAAVESYTRWLAVELARRGTGIRVNAIAPGFVIGEQNRALLVREDGEPTERGAAVIARTPLGRLAEPGDLVATVLWLASDGARFVTGVVVAVDGGFGAFAGV
jgi:NAD(P)-dependent dehydrogenase (short-subunit alcohol dehydrogenase family)